MVVVVAVLPVPDRGHRSASSSFVLKYALLYIDDSVLASLKKLPKGWRYIFRPYCILPEVALTSDEEILQYQQKF
jgi:hypothetical protein